MTTIPQAVTERYVSNLIHYGRNKEFDIEGIRKLYSKDDGQVVGIYFLAYVDTSIGGSTKEAPGATISQAVRRALEKHGVTFR